MDRKIKFRVWDVKNKQWANNFCTDFVPYWAETDGKFFVRSPKIANYEFIFQQFTGLKDKNGKEIYEGDIIKYNDKCIGGDEGIGEVFYCTDLTLVSAPCFCLFQLERNKIKKRGVNPYFPFDSEIIGNIFQNPELVK